jgi:hypothetical protein
MVVGMMSVKSFPRGSSPPHARQSAGQNRYVALGQSQFQSQQATWKTFSHLGYGYFYHSSFKVTGTLRC